MRLNLCQLMSVYQMRTWKAQFTEPRKTHSQSEVKGPKVLKTSKSRNKDLHKTDIRLYLMIMTSLSMTQKVWRCQLYQRRFIQKMWGRNVLFWKQVLLKWLMMCSKRSYKNLADQWILNKAFSIERSTPASWAILATLRILSRIILMKVCFSIKVWEIKHSENSKL